MTRAWYCIPCDAWYAEADGLPCPACGGGLALLAYQYPEDVFGGPAPDEPVRRPHAVIPNPSPDSVGEGFALAAGLNVLGFTLVGILAGATQGLHLLDAFGVVQFLWILPIVVTAHARGRHKRATGVWIASGITLFLNLSSAGWVFSRF